MTNLFIMHSYSDRGHDLMYYTNEFLICRPSIEANAKKTRLCSSGGARGGGGGLEPSLILREPPLLLLRTTSFQSHLTIILIQTGSASLYDIALNSSYSKLRI